MTPCSEWGLPLEYLNLGWKGKFKVWGILWRPDITVRIDEYGATESLYLLYNVIKLYMNLKQWAEKTETENTPILMLKEIRAKLLK